MLNLLALLLFPGRQAAAAILTPVVLTAVSLTASELDSATCTASQLDNATVEEA